MKQHTRHEFLKAAGAGAACIALLSASGCKPDKGASKTTTSSTANIRPVASTSLAHSGDVWAFRSRQDLSPPAIEVNARTSGTAPGYIFVAPKEGAGQDGPMILDSRGRLIWFNKGWSARNFKLQQYRGEPVLTWWNGRVVQGHGVGEYVIFDNSYREIARVQAGNGYRGDLHEFLITSRDTALLTAYNAVSMDLSSFGGPSDGAVWDGIFQEIDIGTGQVLFEWHSLDHVDIDNSYHRLPEDPARPFDYFHINSIDVDHDDNLIISSRNTWAVYKVDRDSGEVIWRLGGKKSDFEMGEGTRTAWQHDARRQEDGTLTIFDNGAAPKVHDHSRGIIIELDMDRMKASLVRQYTRPKKLLATSQGNVQMLPNRNAFIGWGSEPFFSEFSNDGELLFDAKFHSYPNETYRAFRFPWVGHPGEDPIVVAESGKKEVTLYASWNGATEVASWRVLAGPSPESLRPLGAVPWDGFETVISVQSKKPYIKVQARDRSGQVLGTSKTIKLPD